MPFKSRLRIEHIRGTELYKLIEPLIYVTWKGIERIMPVDYTSDGHSYPKLLRSVLGSPFASKTAEAAWYHDWLLDTLVAEGSMRRGEADSEYSRAMSDLMGKSIPEVFTRKRNWVGVRIGAFFNWIKSPWKKRRGS